MAELTTPRPYEVVIEARPSGLHLEWRELWEYRDLLALLVRRDFIARYRQTALGPLWHLLQPVLTMAIFVVIFSRVAQIPTDGLPAPLFYLGGLLGWNYFAQNLTTGSGAFVNNQALFSKVWFPRLVVPVAAIFSNLVAFALQLVPFIAFLAYYLQTDAGVHLTWRVILTPLPVLHIAALSLGVGLLMAASTARFRDMIHLNQYLVQLGMFATPIIYPLSHVPAKWGWLIHANPMSFPVETMRWCLLGQGTLPPLTALWSIAATAGLVAAGIFTFQNAARRAVDTV